MMADIRRRAFLDICFRELRAMWPTSFAAIHAQPHCAAATAALHYARRRRQLYIFRYSETYCMAYVKKSDSYASM